MEDKFFTLQEVSLYLKIPKSTLYKLSQKGKIPSCKIGKQLRFRKSSLDKWLTEKENKSPNLTNEPFLASSNSAIASPKPKRVLLIDDDTLVLKTLDRCLKIQGYAVEPAESGEQALEKVEKQHFDLVIADIRMPGINGIETIERIRQVNARYNRPNIAEIIITGYMDTRAQQEAGELGITDYIYKPFIINEFIQTVKKRLEFSQGLN